jgi:hypothetical protein
VDNDLFVAATFRLGILCSTASIPVTNYTISDDAMKTPRKSSPASTGIPSGATHTTIKTPSGVIIDRYEWPLSPSAAKPPEPPQQ